MDFNQTKNPVEERTRTTNYEGGEAYTPDSPKLGLYKNVINNLLEDTYYQEDEHALQEVVDRFDDVAREAPEFALKLAAYAREEMYLRDVSQLLLVLAAHDDRTQPYVRKYAPDIIQRADEPCTVVAINDMLFGLPPNVQIDLGASEPDMEVHAAVKLDNAREMRAPELYPEDAEFTTTLPKPLKKGINDALHQFDKHQFDKYDRTQRKVNIRDVINRTHPEPQDDERAEAFERLMRGNLDNYPDVEPLDPAETWEVVLSDRKTRAVSGTVTVEEAGDATGTKSGIDTENGTVYVTQSQKTGDVQVEIPSGVHTDRIKIETADGYPEQPPNPLAGECETTADSGMIERIPLGRPVADVQLTVTVYIDQAREAWEEVLPKMGMFATIRNLRNMLEAGVPEETIVEELDIEYVRDSKIYPFRFYQSYKALKDNHIRAPEIERWLSEAIDLSAENLPDDLARTHVSVDLSASMRDQLSEHSTMTRKEIGALFGAILSKKGAIVSAFGEGFRHIEAHVDTPTLEIVDKILSTEVGHSTNGWKAIDYLRNNEIAADRIVLFTDEQIWDSTRSMFMSTGTQNTVKSSFEDYRQEVAPESYLYMIDLSSYGTLSTPEGMDGVFNISGWNDNVLQFIQNAENEDDAIREVEAYEVERPEAQI